MKTPSSISSSRSPSSRRRSRSCAIVQDDSAVDISEEIDRLQQEEPAAHQGHLRQAHALAGRRRSRAIRSGRTRSTTSDEIFTDFQELHGDRAFADDPSIVGGLARFNGQAVHGDRPPEGPRHQGARSAQLRHAAARGLPQGAAPDEARREVRPAGVHASSTRRAPIPASTPRSAASRRRSAATSTRWRELEVPIIVTIIGEGGSGGALAIASATSC